MSLATAAAAEQPRVLVVGAGFAGLAAALACKQQGISATVLEARDEPGGRARTWQRPGMAVELGATWLHGLGTADQPNPVFAHAVEMGLLSSNPERTSWWEPEFLRAGGAEPLAGDDLIEVQRAVAAYGAAVEGVDGSRGGSLGEQLDEAWGELEAGGLLQGRSQLAACAWRWREHLQCVMDGCSTTAGLSAQGSALYEEMGEGHVPIPAGFQEVARRLAEGLDVRYGHEVGRIEWGPQGVALRCSNGAISSADAAIVTLPLGVLKARAQELFRPRLPERTEQAISRLGTSPVDKLFVEFSFPPPPPDCKSADTGSCSPAEAAPQAAGAVRSYSLLWGAAPVDEIAAGELPPWSRQVYSVRLGGPEVKLGSGGLAPSAGPGVQAAARPAAVAVVWMSGPGALAAEQAPDGEVLEVLERIFALYPGIRLPPGASWRRARLHRSRWGGDLLALGGYSYIATGASVADVEALREPLWPGGAPGGGGGAGGERAAPVLLLSGDACHERFMGTTHGAYLSGRSQALRLAAAWRLGGEPEGGA